jgi:alpha/beta superfamily hydrolase
VRVPSALVDPDAASLPVTTPDGIALEADVADASDPLGAAVLLHPHPRYGGNRFNAVVAALFRALPAVGITALRIDFRPGAGAPDGDLADERVDAAAALDALADHVPGIPLYLVGYSFGGLVALGVEHAAVEARVVIAPPLTVMPVPTPPPLPTLVLVAAYDNFAPPATVAPIVAGWKDTTMEVIDAADHFMLGRAAEAAERTAAWLGAR